VTVTVTDNASSPRQVVTRSFVVTVNAVNDAPELLGDRYAIVYEDGQGLAKLVPDNFGIVEVDSSIVSASLVISEWEAEDSVTWNAGNAIAVTTQDMGTALKIELAGSSSTSNYAAFISSIGYETTKAIDSVSTKSILIEVSDGALVSGWMEVVVYIKPVPESVTQDMGGENPLKYVENTILAWYDADSLVYDHHNNDRLVRLYNRSAQQEENLGFNDNDWYDPDENSIQSPALDDKLSELEVAEWWFVVKSGADFEVSSNNTLTIQSTDSIQEVIALNTQVNEDQRKAISFYLSNRWGIAANTDSDADGKQDNQDQRLYERVVVGTGKGGQGPSQFDPDELGNASKWVQDNGTLELIDGCAQATQSNPIVVSGKMVLSRTGDFIISSDCLE
jgi:hypothetical protein